MYKALFQHEKKKSTTTFLLGKLVSQHKKCRWESFGTQLSHNKPIISATTPNVITIHSTGTLTETLCSKFQSKHSSLIRKSNHGHEAT